MEEEEKIRKKLSKMVEVHKGYTFVFFKTDMKAEDLFRAILRPR